MTTATVVLGVGSPFGADSIGWTALERLIADPQLAAVPAELLTMEICDRPGITLLDRMRGAHRALLIDAVRAGEPPGTVLRIERDQVDRLQEPVSTHGIGVAEALALGAAIGDLPRKLVLLGMEISTQPDWQPPMDALDALVATAKRELADFF